MTLAEFLARNYGPEHALSDLREADRLDIHIQVLQARRNQLRERATEFQTEYEMRFQLRPTGFLSAPQDNPSARSPGSFE